MRRGRHGGQSLSPQVPSLLELFTTRIAVNVDTRVKPIPSLQTMELGKRTDSQVRTG